MREGRKEREMVFLGRRKEEKGEEGKCKEGDFICAAFSPAPSVCKHRRRRRRQGNPTAQQAASPTPLSVDKVLSRGSMSHCIRVRIQRLKFGSVITGFVDNRGLSKERGITWKSL